MPHAEAKRREMKMKDLNFEAQKPEGLLYVGSPRQYRADCKAGQFKIGASQVVGNRLKMEVIAARFVEGEFFGYDWFQSTRPRGARLHQQNLLITQDFLPSFR